MDKFMLGVGWGISIVGSATLISYKFSEYWVVLSIGVIVIGLSFLAPDPSEGKKE